MLDRTQFFLILSLAMSLEHFSIAGMNSLVAPDRPNGVSVESSICSFFAEILDFSLSGFVDGY